jgi:membrane protease YdiL (CAAX protease family)
MWHHSSAELPYPLDHSVALLVAALVVTVCVAGALLFVLTQQRRAVTGSPDAEESAWGVGDLVIVALVGGVLAVTIIGADVFVWGKQVGAPELTGWALVRGLVVQNLALVGTALLWIRQRYGRGLRDLGWRLENWRREVPVGIALGALVFAGADAVQWLTGLVLSKLTNPDLASQLMDQFGMARVVDGALSSLPGWGMAVAVLVIAVLVPIGEELLFRGFAYTALKRRLGVPGGVVVSALVFAVLHASPADFAALFAVGVALAWVYEWRGTLLAPILAHALNNLASAVLLLLGLG